MQGTANAGGVSLSLTIAVLVGVGSFVLVASGKQKSAKVPEGPPPSILMVGDSLSVGKFGEVVQGHLEQKYPWLLMHPAARPQSTG
jgi:hypothetical protein